MTQAKIGGLFIDLEARTGRIEKDLANANTKLDQQTKRMAKTAEKNMKRMSTMITGLVAGAFGSLVKSSINAADNIGKLSTRLDVSVEALSQYQLVAEKSGLSFGTLTTGIQRMTRRISEAAKTGKGEAVPALNEMGLSAARLAQLSPEKQFEALADAFSQVDDQGRKVALAMKIFDTEGVALLQTMEGGSEAIRAVRDEADQLGITLDQSAVKKAEEFNDSIAEIRLTLMALAADIAPVFNTIIDGLGLVIDVARNATEEVKDFGIQVGLLDGDEAASVRILREEMVELNNTILNLSQLRQEMIAAGDTRAADAFTKLIKEQDKVLAALAKKLQAAQKAMASTRTEVKKIAAPLKTASGAHLLVAEASRILESTIKEQEKAHKSNAQAIRESIPVLKDTDSIHRDFAASSAELTAFLVRQATSIEEVRTLYEQMDDTLEELDLDKIPSRIEEGTRAWEEQNETLERHRDMMQQIADLASDGIQNIGGAFGVGISGGLAQGLAQMLPAGAQNFIGQVAGQDTLQAAGFAAQAVGAGSEDGAMIGAAIGTAILPGIGTAIGAVLGALVDGEDDPRSEIRTGNFSERASTDDAIMSQFGQVFVRSGVDGFHSTFQDGVTRALTTFLDGIASVLTPEQIADVVLPNNIQLDSNSVRSGDFLNPFLDAVLEVMDEPVQRFVGQFENVQTRLDALAAAANTFAIMDTDPIETFATAMERANETTIDTVSRLSETVTDLGSRAFTSIPDMEAFGAGLQQFNQFVVQALTGFENARRNISSITSSTRDSLTFQTLDDDGQFEFLTRRANQLAAGLGTLGSAEDIQNQVALINQLTQQAIGSRSQEEQRRLLDPSLGFLTGVETIARERIDQLQADTEQQVEATRAANAEAIGNSVADSLDGSGFSGAVVDFGGAIGAFNGGVGDFRIAINQLVSTPLQVVFTGSEIAA